MGGVGVCRRRIVVCALAIVTRVLVTGGSGFIGTNLIESLLADRHDAFSIDVKAPSITTHRPLWRAVDILDADRLRTSLREIAPEVVIHLAARTDLNGAGVSDYQSNTHGVRNVIDAAAAAGVRRVLFASSRLVCRIGYQPTSPTDYVPTTPYGESKVVGEKLVRAAVNVPFDWVILRPTSIWGPWFHVPYRNFFDAIRRGRYLHPRGQRVYKSFGYVGNSVHQLTRLMQAPHDDVHGQMFYLADYEPLEVLSWGDMVRRAFDVAPIRQVPMGVMRLAAGVGDGLSRLGWKGVPLTRFRLDNLVTEMLHDTSGLAAACGALPFDLQTGVTQTVRWMRDEPSNAAG